MLAPGNGVEGVIFTQFPQSGDLAAANPADTASYNKERRAGVIAWNNIAEKMTSDFPGRVMYFPMADSVMLHGKYSAWLPPEGDPHAPSDQWIRVRKLDNVHLCPEGSARYAAALLADMTAVFRLAPATGDWSQGAWTTDPDFNNPPGACPDDHPPGLAEAACPGSGAGRAVDGALRRWPPTSRWPSWSRCRPPPRTSSLPVAECRWSTTWS